MLLRPWDSPGKNTGVGCHSLLQEIFLTQGSNPGLPHCRRTLYRLSYQGNLQGCYYFLVSLGLVIHAEGIVQSPSCVRPFVTPWTGAYQAPRSMEFSRQEYWSGLPCPSPGNLPNPGIEPGSPTLQADSLPSGLPWWLRR